MTPAQRAIQKRALLRLAPDFYEPESEIIGLEEQRGQIYGILKDALCETGSTGVRTFLMVGPEGSGRNHVGCLNVCASERG